MANITNGNITCSFSVGAKNSSGQFTISATFTNTHSTSTVFNVRLSCSLTNGSPWSRIDVGTLGPGASASGSVTISSGNVGSQSVYCYLLYGSSSTGPGGAYNVPAYIPPTPPTPTYYEHTLSYDANGGSGQPSDQKTTNTTSTYFKLTISSEEPIRDGYQFIGWGDNIDKKEAQYLPGGTYEFSSRNKTIFALWKSEPKPLTINKYGEGSITINGESPKAMYNKGETLVVSVRPNNTTAHYYLSRISRVTNNVETVVTQSDTIRSFDFSFIFEDETTIELVFYEREQYTLSVDSTYQVSGTGAYLYLDTPTLLVNLEGNLVVFDGWYEGDNKLSDANPFTITMPNRNILLTLRTGGEIFTNQKVRQFALQNGQGEIYKLTSKLSNIFLNDPNGLGFRKSIKTFRLGNAEIVGEETLTLPTPSGELVFLDNGISKKYEDYYDFVRFVSKKPITFWYRTPNTTSNNTFHIPVEIMSLDKSEIKEDGVLRVPFSTYGLNFWQITQTSFENSGHEVEVYSDSDFNVGVKIIVSLEDNLPFNNPKIIFKQNDEVYGAIAIFKDNITKLEIDTRDKKQTLTLYEGEDIIPNPFAYIDFSFASEDKEFPFPKLKQGYTTIAFNYDNESEANKTYIIEFDKEYVSV